MMTQKTIASPLGELRLYADNHELVALYLHPPWLDAVDKKTDVLELAAAQLREYFAGKRRTFDLPLAPRGTAFQERVWRALLAIPFGETCSYGDIARAIGRPSASRAVGAANGKNPIAIIIPCHRVIGTSGALVGYGGGLPTKRWLLEHEYTSACPGSSSRSSESAAPR